MQTQSQRHESPLGAWETHLATPDAWLREHVSVLWDVAGSVSYEQESILPTGAVEILFNLGDDQYLVDETDVVRRTRYNTVWVSGLQQRSLTIQSDGQSNLVGIRLTAMGAWRFFGLPMHEISNRVLDLDLVLGRSLLDLREQFQERLDPQWRLWRLNEFVARRIQAGPPPHPSVLAALSYIGSTRGSCRTDSLAALTGVSQKHLIGKFHNQVGLSPKAVARIVRFRNALSGLVSAGTSDLCKLALDFGYCDQAHFNREFRFHAGATPIEFLRRRMPDDTTVAMVASTEEVTCREHAF